MAFVPGVPQIASFPRKQPLSPNPYDQLNDMPSFDAYNQCLLHEMEANATNDQLRLMYARCLGHLISEAPSMDSRNVIVHEIIQCHADPDKMDSLASLYINHLLRLFRQQKGHTPLPSDHPSRPSFEEHREFFGAAADPAPKDHKTAKDSALRRDGYCCMITGYADSVSFDQMTLADQQAFGLVGRVPRVTNYCHIFPPSTNWNLKPDEFRHPKTTYCGNVWSIVSLFGGIDVLSELDGVKAHRLSNGLTLTPDAHSMFDMLSLWFEEVPDQVNTYVVRTLHPDPAFNRVVTFTSASPDLELPNPKYLGLHAAVCRVAHMSGAAGYLDLFDRKVETMKVLAHDGSSVDLLGTRLRHVLLTA